MSEQQRKQRRTYESLDNDVMDALERLVSESGFGNIGLVQLCEEAGIEASVFYRRYGTMEHLYDALARKYDFWITEAVNITRLNELGPREMYKETLKTIARDLISNPVLGKLLIWELSSRNITTISAANMRETMNLSKVVYFSELFRSTGLNMNCITAMFTSGIYYLILHRDISKLCTIDFNTPEGETILFDTIDQLVDMVFNRLEEHELRRKSIDMMIKDGIAADKIAAYLHLTKNEMKLYIDSPRKRGKSNLVSGIK